MVEYGTCNFRIMGSIRTGATHMKMCTCVTGRASDGLIHFLTSLYNVNSNQALGETPLPWVILMCLLCLNKVEHHDEAEADRSRWFLVKLM